jgi:Domain of unknown function (DUF1905)/Bacteriocin-protection, YdeI or OmpD-Associated
MKEGSRKAKALVNKSYRLEKFPGKGGWTYARIPEIVKDKSVPFGWVKVKGSIDGFPLKHYRLMPMGKGMLFLPVKADIRKKLGKKEGDLVKVVLYPDNDALEIPAELLECLQDEPKALTFFKGLSDSEKNFYIKWIYSAKREATKVDRLAKTVNRLMSGLKLYDKA